MKIALAVLAVVALIGCSSEGTGGSGLISGVVTELVVDKDGGQVESRNAQDVKVFIKYGDSKVVNDEVETDTDGYYEFPYLIDGNYEVSAYSDCVGCAAELATVAEATSVESGEVTTVNLSINKMVEPDDGSSSVVGRLMVQKYLGSTAFGDPYAGQDRKVYITYGTDEVFFDKTDAAFDGKFEFRNLIKGDYTVYAYSQCDTCVNTNEIETLTFTIATNGSSTSLGDLTVKTQ